MSDQPVLLRVISFFSDCDTYCEAKIASLVSLRDSGGVWTLPLDDGDDPEVIPLTAAQSRAIRQVMDRARQAHRRP